MSANKEKRSQHVARRRECDDSDPGEQRASSATRQANEVARARASALKYVRLPKRKLPAMLWIAHQLGAIVRKGGVPC